MVLSARKVATAASICFLLPVLAKSDGWIMLSPGPGYRISWQSAADTNPFLASPQVTRQGLSPLDRWFQVAPGGNTVALWSSSTGLAVFAARGVELFRRKSGITAFRFSPQGDRLAFASAKGIEIFTLNQHEARRLTSLSGVESTFWTDLGLIARTRSNLYLIDEAGNRRTLAELHPNAVVATRKGRLVYFQSGSLMTLDLASPRAASVTKLADHDPVINAEMSHDGSKLLFATSKRVYFREGSGPVRLLAAAPGVQSLFFSPDGATYLWVTGSGSGSIIDGDKTTALPAGTRSARFSQNGGSEIVLTTEEGVATWNATTGTRSLLGGISSDDGVNLAGDLAGKTGVVAFYYKKSGYQKETQTPKFPLQ